MFLFTYMVESMACNAYGHTKQDIKIHLYLVLTDLSALQSWHWIVLSYGRCPHGSKLFGVLDLNNLSSSISTNDLPLLQFGV